MRWASVRRPTSRLPRPLVQDIVRIADDIPHCWASEDWQILACWVFITGGCSGRGVQWIGVALYNKLVYKIIQITTPCFHCTPPLRNVEMSSSEGPLWVVLSTRLQARHNSACSGAHQGAHRGTYSSRDGCFDAATHCRSHETGSANTKILCPPAGAPSSEHFAHPQPMNHSENISLTCKSTFS